MFGLFARKPKIYYCGNGDASCLYYEEGKCTYLAHEKTDVVVSRPACGMPRSVMCRDIRLARIAGAKQK